VAAEQDHSNRPVANYNDHECVIERIWVSCQKLACLRRSAAYTFVIEAPKIMKRKAHIPDDPTEENIRPCLDALNYTGEITLKMMEAEAHALLRRRMPHMMRELGRLLRKRYAGCIARIDYPPSTGRKGFVRTTLNRLFDGFFVPVCQIRLRLSWRVDPVFDGVRKHDGERALRQLQRKLRREGVDYQQMVREAGADRWMNPALAAQQARFPED
jgi:hypothetical protein